MSQMVLTKYEEISNAENLQDDIQEYLELLKLACERYKDMSFKITANNTTNKVTVKILRLNCHLN